MAASPGHRVVEAFLAPTSRLFRRMEIYENDGKTPWRPDLWDRLTDGSVSGQFERDEKYACEFSLDNRDGELNHAPRKLWYDKVFKPFMGIALNPQLEQPLVMVAETTGLGDENAARMRVLLLQSGFTNVQINATAEFLSDIAHADIVVFAGQTELTKTSLMQQAYESGKSVIAFCTSLTHTQAPFMFSGTNSTTPPSVEFECSPVYGSHPVARRWAPWWAETQSDYHVLQPNADTMSVSLTPDFYGPSTPGGVWVQEKHGARIVAIQFSDFEHFTPEPPSTGDPIVAENPVNSGLFEPGAITNEEPADSGLFVSDPFHEDRSTGLFFLGEPVFNTNVDDSRRNFSQMCGSALRWLDTRSVEFLWETQLGEYQADSVEVDEDGDQIRISARDYAKRAKGSKLVNATTFSAGASIRSIITAVAANAGISKQNVPPMPENLGIDTTFEADTERWEVIKEICTAHSYEVFFDHFGFLTVRKYNDPLSTPPTLTLSGGQFGNLVDIGSRANDSRLFNHIVVRGESNDRSIPPVAAEALNTNVESPVSVQRIGDRVEIVKSSLVTTVQQAQELADARLRVSSLEEFEVNFSAIAFPWVEPGDIVEVSEQRAGVWWPMRYLISSVEIPFDMSPMTGVGKRVTIVL